MVIKVKTTKKSADLVSEKTAGKKALSTAANGILRKKNEKPAIRAKTRVKSRAANDSTFNQPKKPGTKRPVNIKKDFPAQPGSKKTAVLQIGKTGSTQRGQKEKKLFRQVSDSPGILTQSSRTGCSSLKKAAASNLNPGKKESGKTQRNKSEQAVRPVVNEKTTSGSLNKKIKMKLPPINQDKTVRKQPETPVIIPADDKARKHPDHWSDCGQIFFTAGKGFGISPNLRTICLGPRPVILEFLNTGNLDDSLSRFQKDVLYSIQETRKEVRKRNLEEVTPVKTGSRARLNRKKSPARRHLS